MRGASLTMLHQPTPRTDLQRWADETTAVINMIDAKAVVVSDPFMAAAPLLSQLGMQVLTAEQLLDSRPIDPIDTDDDDVALLTTDVRLDRLPQGGPDQSPQRRIECRGDVRRRRRRR